MPYNTATQLITLGQLRLEGSNFTRAKPLLLLCYLAIEGPQSRRVLAELFFSVTKHPRDALSTTFRRLKQLGDAVVTTDGDRIMTGLACDANELLHTQAGQLETALRRYQGAFLTGLDLSLSDELKDWVYQQRETFACLLVY